VTMNMTGKIRYMPPPLISNLKHASNPINTRIYGN
jgi:hypothetical protein